MAGEMSQNYHLQKIALDEGAEPSLKTLAGKLANRTWSRKGGVSFLDPDDLKELREDILKVANSCKMQRKSSNRDALIVRYDRAGPCVVKNPMIIILLDSHENVVPKLSTEDLEIGSAMYLEQDVQITSGTTILVLRLDSTEGAD